VLEVHEGFGRPEVRAELLSSHHVTGSAQQEEEDLEGLLLEPGLHSLPAQLAGGHVHFKSGEAENRRRGVSDGIVHGRRLRSPSWSPGILTPGRASLSPRATQRFNSLCQRDLSGENGVRFSRATEY
jgi:hypothetical protein